MKLTYKVNGVNKVAFLHLIAGHMTTLLRHVRHVRHLAFIVPVFVLFLLLFRLPTSAEKAKN